MPFQGPRLLCTPITHARVASILAKAATHILESNYSNPGCVFTEY